jgi:hypothetical protein
LRQVNGDVREGITVYPSWPWRMLYEQERSLLYHSSRQGCRVCFSSALESHADRSVCAA